MAVCYDKLFHLMIDKKISNVQLKDMAGVGCQYYHSSQKEMSISQQKALKKYAWH